MRKSGKTIFILAALTLLSVLAFGEEFSVGDAVQLQNALTEAAANGEDDIIKVAQGTYVGNFVFDSAEGNSITLLGGYSPDCASRILDPSSTILDGDDDGRVLFMNNPGSYQGGDIYINGFTIQNGNAVDKAGGLYAASCVMGFPGCITIENNIISGNSAPAGGGICAYTDDEDFGPFSGERVEVKIRRMKTPRSRLCRTRIHSNGEGDIAIIGNVVESNTGGGIVASTNADLIAGSITISGNIIMDNTGKGVSTSTWGGATKIEGNMISGNTSLEKGGGVYASSFGEYGGGNIALVNNIIFDNSSVEGGGVYSRTNGMVYAGDLYLVNNTITGNLCSDSGGGVCIECTADSTLNLYNNIIWGNSAPAGGDIFMKVDWYNWIESNGFNNDYIVLDGIWTGFGGNIHADPRFKDPGKGDFHLGETSPCIDTGITSAPRLPEYDFDGDPRILDGDADGKDDVDIGADEFVWVPLQTLTVLSSSGGSTDPAPGEHTYPQGTEVTVTALPDNHFRFSHWGGDVSGTKNPIKIIMDSDKSITANFLRIIYPPLDFSGQKVLNRSLSQAEYIDVLTWQANPDNVDIVKYRIYQVENENKNLLVELNANTFGYWHRRVEKDKQYTYTICAVNNEGTEGAHSQVTVY